MTGRKLFGTNKLIADFTKQRLIKVSVLDDGWSTKYIDVSTGQYWLKYVVDDRGFYENMMIILPNPTTDELIEIAFSSLNPDEVSAAATRLSIEEQIYKQEFRRKLLDRLTAIDVLKLKKVDKERVKTIIQASNLTDNINNRDVLRKHVSDIETDAAFFNSVAESAKEILQKVF